MTITSGLAVTLAITWAVAIALYAYARNVEYREGLVLRPSEPTVISPLWEALRRLYYTAKAAHIPNMSAQWRYEQKRNGWIR